ncbi:iron ABC transporter permease [Escherichia coli]|uniref:Iron ABC transporter permease n=1 Tax=Escherichia coli TaxID=562 RepID=A0A3S4P3F9_ECOLX|nr:iron ABC transporter permease [Escherichia coli]
MNVLLEPFSYEYMLNAMWVSAMVGGLCAFLSCYLMLKGWSLIGDALSHSIVPGVAGAYMLGLPFSLGAFFSGGLAAGSMLFLNQRTRLKEDAIIGLIFSSFFGLGLFMVSLNPTSVNIQTIVLGNILAIDPADILQLTIIGILSIIVLFFQMERSYGDLFRRESRSCYWIASGQIKNPLLHPAVGFDRCGAANGWCLSGDLSGGDSRCNSMVVNRSFSPPAHNCCNYWQCNQFPRRVGQLLSGRRDRWNHRGGADTAVSFSICICAHPWAFGKSSACA